MIASLGRSFIHLIYPPLCLSCRESLAKDSSILCHECVAQLEFIDSTQRCPRCFSSDFCAERCVCADCSYKKTSLNGISAAFDYIGPAASLIRQIKYGDKPYLTKGCAGYIAAQFLRMEWPMPDLIIPVPISFTHWLGRGYNQSFLLAETLGEILNCPVMDLLRRRSGDYSQAGLTRQQRLEMEGATIYLKDDSPLHQKTILLIDDVMTTGTTLEKCAEVLLQGFPSSIYAITFCKAVH